VFGVVAVAATRVRLEVQAVVGSWTTCVSACSKVPLRAASA
jgi:hypothetical protein